MRILLVEDDAILGDGILAGLKLAEHAVDWVRDGEAARLALLDHSYEACVLDLGLPKRDGITVLKELRGRGNRLPVLILTARDSSADKIAGLDAGADDYLTKPFDLAELLARLRALVRRAAGEARPTLEHGGVVLDPASRQVTLNGLGVALSAREYALLDDLLRHKNHIGLQAHLDRSVALCQAQSAQLFINDHWRAALQTLAHRFETDSSGPNAAVGLHLGQEDLLALDATDRRTLLDARQRLMLGLSSHSLWELARAAGCGASLIACGPVQPTTTKDMPWVPQGTDNLSWWVRHSPAPVVAIGGLLTPDDVQEVGHCHPAAACVVRGLGQDLPDMQAQVPRLQQAWRATRRAEPVTLAHLPHPCLPTHPAPTPAVHAPIHRTIPELAGRPSTLAMHTLSLSEATGLPADTPRAGLPASPA